MLLKIIFPKEGSRLFWGPEPEEVKARASLVSKLNKNLGLSGDFEVSTDKISHNNTIENYHHVWSSDGNLLFRQQHKSPPILIYIDRSHFDTEDRQVMLISIMMNWLKDNQIGNDIIFIPCLTITAADYNI